MALLQTKNYDWEDTLTGKIILGTKLGNFSPLIYPLAIWKGNELAYSGASELGALMVTLGVVGALVDVVVISLAQANCEGEFFFSPISKLINSAMFNTAVYTALIPAKLVAKVLVKKEFAHQNKLLKTAEGKEILAKEYKAKMEKEENKEELRRLKTQLSQTNYQAKVSRKVARIDEKNSSIKSDIRAVE